VWDPGLGIGTTPVVPWAIPSEFAAVGATVVSVPCPQPRAISLEALSGRTLSIV